MNRETDSRRFSWTETTVTAWVKDSIRDVTTEKISSCVLPNIERKLKPVSDTFPLESIRRVTGQRSVADLH